MPCDGSLEGLRILSSTDRTTIQQQQRALQASFCSLSEIAKRYTYPPSAWYSGRVEASGAHLASPSVTGVTEQFYTFWPRHSAVNGAVRQRSIRCDPIRSVALSGSSRTCPAPKTKTIPSRTFARTGITYWPMFGRRYTFGAIALE